MTQGKFCAASCGRPPCPPVTGLITVLAPVAECTDIPPGEQYTCEQQRQFGKCTTLWMLQGGYCAQTCGLPPCSAPVAEGTLTIVEATGV